MHSGAVAYLDLRLQGPSFWHRQDNSRAIAQRVGANEHNLSLRRSSLTGKKEPITRIEGFGLLHAETIQGTPPVLEHLLTNLPALYKICVFFTVR